MAPELGADARHEHRDIAYLRVHGKGGKTRYVPLHPAALGAIGAYLDGAGHGGDDNGALFRRLHHWRDPLSPAALTPDGVYRIALAYETALGFPLGALALRATAATNALNHDADIAKAQEWLGDANISTTHIYD